MSAIRVTPIPCLRDNYAYLVSAGQGDEAIVVDACEAAPVLDALEEHQLRLIAILTTHHHSDHVGGNGELSRRIPSLRVLAHASEAARVPAMTDGVEHAQHLELIGVRWQAVHVPGHTRGAVAYVGGGVVFTGDTLFVAGCGRLFEGTPEVMYASLNDRIGALPPSTLVYCGHEYTRRNLEFAHHVEPSNSAVAAALSDLTRQDDGPCTVPSTILQERRINPFLRCTQPEVVATVAGETLRPLRPAEVFARLRNLKDGF